MQYTKLNHNKYKNVKQFLVVNKNRHTSSWLSLGSNGFKSIDLKELDLTKTKIKQLLVLTEIKNSQTPHYLNFACTCTCSTCVMHLQCLTARAMKRADTNGSI